jgi:hypothetical protein
LRRPPALVIAARELSGVIAIVLVAPLDPPPPGGEKWVRLPSASAMNVAPTGPQDDESAVGRDIDVQG